MSRRTLIIGLVVSLAVNLFVLGGLAGAALMGVLRPPPGRGPPGPPHLAAIGQALSPEHREAWRNTLRGGIQTAGPKLRQAHSLRSQAWQGLLTSDPANPQAALATLDQARALEFQARADMDRTVVGFAATLPLEERRRIGEAMSRMRPHMRGAAPWAGVGPAEAPGSGGGRPVPEDGPPPLPDR